MLQLEPGDERRAPGPQGGVLIVEARQNGYGLRRWSTPAAGWPTCVLILPVNVPLDGGGVCA